MGQIVSDGGGTRLSDLGKRDMRAQFAALCWRQRDDKIEVLLITSRDSGRWVIPKGWPMQGKAPQQAAGIEALEEAGVRGIVSERAVGVFTYLKEMADGVLPVLVAVFPLAVSKVLGDWPEKGERTRQWMTLKKAARTVSDPELARILSDPTLPKLLR